MILLEQCQPKNNNSSFTRNSSFYKSAVTFQLLYNNCPFCCDWNATLNYTFVNSSNMTMLVMNLVWVSRLFYSKRERMNLNQSKAKTSIHPPLRTINFVLTFFNFKNNDKTAYSRVGKAIIFYPLTSRSDSNFSSTKRTKYKLSQGKSCTTSSNMKIIWKCLHMTLNIILDRFNQIIYFTRITVAD